MTKINYAQMSDRELKRYLLTHRDDLEAFHAYMDRRHSRPRETSITFDDPQWEEKILSAIRAQLSSSD
ncbi:hypothetical protein NIES593_07115 [Hydrococcus rivularis NIES-593]|uniref:Uncharacterized protein n=1 Tax=Hydrococcus rivularis NIES-593 TaxID=1921803 RepID=A0A1U7HLH4_9CYAN|nr:hypothetical protein [Hydrococcus rivularis]OKH24443.1 hypothetical protein NIES593_07115 [Hydrococcus rivularis NIES-593]